VFAEISNHLEHHPESLKQLHPTNADCVRRIAEVVSSKDVLKDIAKASHKTNERERTVAKRQAAEHERKAADADRN